MSQWSVSNLGAAVEQYSSVVGESLHYFNADIWQTYIDRVGHENIRCVWSGAPQQGEFAGGLAFYRMGQWYGGQRVASAGVSGVGIDPAFRGSGACKHLLQSTLSELFEEGMPIAALYASTRGLYRSVGFEISGHRIDYSLKMPSFRRHPDARELQATRTLTPDFAVLAKLAEHRGRIQNGNIDRTDGMWQRILEPIGRTSTSYLIGDPTRPDGFITLLHGKRELGHPQALTASDYYAATPAAMQRIIALILDHRSMCDRLVWYGGPQDDLMLAAVEEHLEIPGQLLTLNRIIHLKNALESRGYPKHLNASLVLVIDDPLLTGNSGRWALRVQDGEGTLEQAGSLDPYASAGLEMSIQTLVPLYTSMYTCSQLVKQGRVRARTTEAVELADAIFAGPAPWTVELF